MVTLIYIVWLSHKTQKEIPTKPTIKVIMVIAITKVLSCLQTKSDPELIANLLGFIRKLTITIPEEFPQVLVYPYPTDSVNSTSRLPGLLNDHGQSFAMLLSF